METLIRIKNIPKARYWDYFIVAARCLLAINFLVYGYGKLTGGQFGLNEAELATPIKDLSLFRVGWYLFGHEPFETFIGVSQIICGILLLINRTVLLGAFMFLPIAANILVIDLTIMTGNFATGFAWRLSYYLLLDLLILGHYQEKLQVIWKAVWQNVQPQFKHPLWAYVLLPVLALVLEFVPVVPRALIDLMLHKP